MKIKFSHKYVKLELEDGSVPPWATLLAVFNSRFEDLGKAFKAFDTQYYKRQKVKGFEKLEYCYYPLPKKGECLVLLFQYGDLVFTTVRRSHPAKEKYYRKSVGKEFEVVVK
ncbi:MAG: hypothetical protein ACE5DI_04010 [Candidatus Micrarchaeia archaeon]